MKYLKICICFVLCLFDVFETIRYAENENLILIVNKLTTINENWISIINNRKILINNTFQTINVYLEELNVKLKPSTSSLQKKHYVSKSNVLQILNFMYTALKCEYAYLIHDILKKIYCEHYLFTKNSIDKLLESIKILRKHLDKVIFNLFNFEELSSDLKSSDQTLTASLLSIHMFLYYNDIKNIDYINILKKLICQMIFLVDNFICKMCFFKFTDLDMSIEAQESESNSLEYLSRLEKFSDIGLNDDEYISDMYNPYNYLMYSTNVSELSEIIITSTSVPKKSTDIFNLVTTSYNIKNVLIYQIFLIELLKSIFSVKIMNVLHDTNDNSNEKYSQFAVIYDGFREYMNLIPDNYPQISLKFINNIEKALEINSIEITSDNFLSLSDILDKLTIKPIILLEDKSSQIDSMTIISITNLIKNITGSPYFQSFKQTFKILLQELNILEDYYLIDKTNYIKKSDQPNLCSMMSSLHNKFIWLWVLQDKIMDENLRLHLDLHLLNIIKRANYLYTDEDTELIVKKSLLNLLNHVNHMKSKLFNDISSSEFILVKQLVMSTIISLDYHEINNCTMTEKLTINYMLLKSLSSFSFPDILIEIDEKMKQFSDKTNASILKEDVQTEQTYIAEVKQSDEVVSDKTQFYWFVHKKQVLNICQDLYQDFKTPDIQEIYKLRLTVLEWYLYQVYTKVLCMFKDPNKLPSNKHIVLIGEDLKILHQSLTFSTYLMRIVKYFIIIYLDHFKDTIGDQKCIEQFINKVNVQFEASDDVIQKFKSYTIDKIYDKFKGDIDYIKYYFIDTNNDKLINDENDFPMFIFLNELDIKYKP